MPKRKATRGGKTAGGKKAKVVPPENETSNLNAAIEIPLETNKNLYKMDKTIQVVDGFNCRFTQTDPGTNANKYHVIQVVFDNFDGRFYALNRWGFVGGRPGLYGHNYTKTKMPKEDAVAEFNKTFMEKTKNNWENCGSFCPIPGEYTMEEKTILNGTDPEYWNKQVPWSSAIQDTIEAPTTCAKSEHTSHKVDAQFPFAKAAQVHGDYDCMLNQTNVGANNNKYYIIQVLQQGAQFYTWNRWGRVGQPGQTASKGPLGKDQAIADFKKKFKDKTKNNWDTRSDFNPVPGKYTMLEMDADN